MQPCEAKCRPWGGCGQRGKLRPQARIEACKVSLRTTAPKGDAALNAQLSPFSFQTMLCAPRAGARRLKRSCGEDRRARRTGPNACSDFPPSLINIFKEIQDDLGHPVPTTGNLIRWADQGVLLLNATLTVRAHQAGSHQNRGWETFTDAVIHRLAAERSHIVYILWGSYAQKKGAFIDSSRNLVLKSAHPSPLSAYRGFFGNKHFSKANDYLIATGQTPIEW